VVKEAPAKQREKPPQRSHRRLSAVYGAYGTTSWNCPKEGDEKRMERLFEGSLFVKPVAYFGRGRSFSGLCIRAKWVLLLSVVGVRRPSRNRS
jgi:hypothetical protein